MITIPVKTGKLKELRREAKVLQIDVEMGCDIPVGRLTQFETGRARPTPDHVEKLAIYYKVKASDIIDDNALKNMHSDLIRFARLTGASIEFNKTGEELDAKK